MPPESPSTHWRKPFFVDVVVQPDWQRRIDLGFDRLRGGGAIRSAGRRPAGRRRARRADRRPGRSGRPRAAGVRARRAGRRQLEVTDEDLLGERCRPGDAARRWRRARRSARRRRARPGRRRGRRTRSPHGSRGRGGRTAAPARRPCRRGTGEAERLTISVAPARACSLAGGAGLPDVLADGQADPVGAELDQAAPSCRGEVALLVEDAVVGQVDLAVDRRDLAHRRARRRRCRVAPPPRRESRRRRRCPPPRRRQPVERGAGIAQEVAPSSRSSGG